MNSKEINLLPEKHRFNVEKHILIKRFFIILSFNILILIFLTTSFILKNSFYKKLISEKEIKLQNFSLLIDNFLIYQKKYNGLKKRLTSLESKKKIYYVNYSQQYSPFLSLLILGRNIGGNINIISLNFSNGVFELNGNASTSDAFYNFYYRLNRDKFIKNVDFFYLKKDENSSLLKFKIKIYLKKL